MKTPRIRRTLVPLVGIALMSMAMVGNAGEPAILGRQVPVEQRIKADQIDHAILDALLKTYVDQQGMVDYARWKATPGDLQALDDYLDHLSAASFKPQTATEVKLAFWINAYNAVTIKGILREYPTTSIRNHTAKLFGYNIWNDLKLVVEERAYSLDEMEHDVLRKLNEPRIHFAIVCASIGCPPLRREAYRAAELDGQLTDNAREFFSDPSKFRFDAERKSFAVSPILDWFGEDFGNTKADRLRQIAPYLPETAAQRAAQIGDAEVTFLEYDWSLNDQATQRD